MGWLAGWVAVSVLAAAILSATPGGAALPEVGHWVGHAVLFGLPPWWLARRGWAPGASVAVGVGAGALVELAQMLAAGRWLVDEAAFDLSLDAVVAMAGCALAGGLPIAEALGSWLHPVVLIAVAGAVLVRSAGAPGDAALAGACLAPAVATWTFGVHRGRFTDVDLRERTQRPALFAVGLAGLVPAAGLAARAALVPGSLAVATVVTAALFLLVTRFVTKPSGHVGGAVWMAVLVAHVSPRWSAVFLGAAALLAWARVRAGVHTRSEVLAGLGLTAFGAALALSLGWPGRP